MRFRARRTHKEIIPLIMGLAGLAILVFALPGWVWLSLCGVGLVGGAVWVYKKGI